MASRNIKVKIDLDDIRPILDALRECVDLVRDIAEGDGASQWDAKRATDALDAAQRKLDGASDAESVDAFLSSLNRNGGDTTEQ